MRERYGVPRNVLDRLAEIGVLTPNQRGYDRDDVEIIEAIAGFRAGGYEEALGFTVYDTLRYRRALEPLVQEEVRALLERLAGEVDVERAMEIVAAGVEPLRELIGAMHSKLLLAELRRSAGRDAPRLTHRLTTSARWSSITPQPSASSTAGQRAGEGAERRAVVRAEDQEVVVAAALGLGVEAQQLALGAPDRAEVGGELTAPTSWGTPSTHTARSLPVGGSLMPLTRFQASAAAVGVAARRRRSSATR